jgi:hypothetical protein
MCGCGGSFLDCCCRYREGDVGSLARCGMPDRLYRPLKVTNLSTIRGNS